MSNGTEDVFLGRTGAIASLTLLTVFAWLGFIFLPVLVDLYIRSYRLSQAEAGVLAGIEVGTLAMVALALSGAIHRRNKRLLCIAGASLVIIGNSCSLFASAPYGMGSSRMVVGAGLGLAVSATNALPALSRKSEFLYALGQFALCIVGSLLIFVVPLALERAGPAGIFGLEISMGVLALLASAGLPEGISATREKSSGRMWMDVATFRVLAGAWVFYLVQTALWAFAGQAGERAGLDAFDVNLYLAASAMAGVGGAALAMSLGTRTGILWPIVLGFLAQATFGLLLYLGPTRSIYIPAVLMITFSSVFVTPYLLALAADLDVTGRVASAAGAFMNFGAMVGPVVAGALTVRFGYGCIGYLSAVLLAGGLAVIIGPAQRVLRGP